MRDVAAQRPVLTRPSVLSQCGLVFERLIKLGGLEAMEKRNIAKAKKIFDAIAASNGFYVCPVAPGVRSVMNIPFTMATPELEKAFLKICDQRGLMQLKGHRSVGGIRASVYNAMPDEGVDALVAVMKARATGHAARLCCADKAPPCFRVTGVPGGELGRAPGAASSGAARTPCAFRGCNTRARLCAKTVCARNARLRQTPRAELLSQAA
jgi:hypothetical protein